MAEPDLRFIGERLERVQAELRELRGVKDDLAQLRLEMDARFARVDARFDAMDARFDAMDARFDAMDARFGAMDARFGAADDRFSAFEKSIDARFRQVHETMATNLAVILAALKQQRPE